MFQTTNQISIHIYLQFTIAYPSQFVPVTDCTATSRSSSLPLDLLAPLDPVVLSDGSVAIAKWLRICCSLKMLSWNQPKQQIKEVRWHFWEESGMVHQKVGLPWVCSKNGHLMKNPRFHTATHHFTIRGKGIARSIAPGGARLVWKFGIPSCCLT